MWNPESVEELIEVPPFGILEPGPHYLNSNRPRQNGASFENRTHPASLLDLRRSVGGGIGCIVGARIGFRSFWRTTWPRRRVRHLPSNIVLSDPSILIRYYDAFLHACEEAAREQHRPPPHSSHHDPSLPLSLGALFTVGLAFECQLLARPVPVGPTDRQLTSLVTQRRVYDCSKAGEPQMLK